MTTKTLKAALLLLAVVFCASRAAAQPERGMNAGELKSALEKLSVTGTVMYIAAHPDDENTALLAYFSKWKKYRTIYLSITRGEGGQNIIGLEKGADLGVIRTEELLAARRVDGAEQMFTRAIDFGYSKTSDETLAMWTRDSVVADIVWAIRSTRPDVIITRFSPTLGGHGNHTASAILAAEAFAKSGDVSAFPEQLRYVRPWKAKKLFFNRLLGFDGTMPPKEPGDVEIDAGVYDPLSGLSSTEIAGISRSLHKTQAMGSEQRRGPKLERFQLTASSEGDGKPVTGADGDLFADINTSWKKYPDGAAIEHLLQQADKELDIEHPDKIVGLLLKAYKKLQPLAEKKEGVVDPLIVQKQKEMAAVIMAALGARCDVLSSSPTVLPGNTLRLDAVLIQRSTLHVDVTALRSPLLGIDTQLQDALQSNSAKHFSLDASLPPSMSASQPYWLAAPADAYLYRVASRTAIGLPENPDSLSVSVTLAIAGEPVTISVPVRYRRIDPTAGEVYRPVVILPKIDVTLMENDLLWQHASDKQVAVRVVSNDSISYGRVVLRTPKGYSVSPAEYPFIFTKTGEEQTFTFTVNPGQSGGSGMIEAVAIEAGDGRTPDSYITHRRRGKTPAGPTQGREWTGHGSDIVYPHIVPQFVIHAAQVHAIRADIRITKSRIGYISGPGDEIPTGLRLCGYIVGTIDDDSLRGGDLSPYETIVVGVRAYNTRPQLRQSNARLLEYVRNGGTLLVQYQTPGRDVESIGPYPFTISRERVTDEHAEMVVVSGGGTDASSKKLSSLLMNVPNKISKADFDGWVQERGLYFADKADAQYEKPFSCHDTNEQPAMGSVLVAPFGKGVYCYTGLAFFRQLPAGVPGAFRLFTNMIELRQAANGNENLHKNR
jgi:LmbE family N-acetylglucosaminyl deacetylase